ncbi:hypothetical protein HPB52_008072 [Rhipicephalus sanguineus]|uniref:Uncharacterized protein n=1 Tax=Rhipicephalus sanguineus TaxID=34632 RepID=A0A9D4PB22_RHISA|nr:hypothetical protein HPB52_008072 [Rhipicephalus sanguineus]
MRTQAETNEFRKANQVTVRGRGVPTPVLGLHEAYFPECVAEAAYALSYGPLTALQSQCWPVALHGRDLHAIAHTRAAAAPTNPMNRPRPRCARTCSEPRGGRENSTASFGLGEVHRCPFRVPVLG